MSDSIILACPTLKKELQQALVEHQCSAPVFYLPQELHNSPPRLREYVQSFIDNIDNVKKIIICVSGCGGGTIGLRTDQAQLIVPKSRDCIDILLSGDDLEKINRPKNGIFYTESWMNFSKNSSLDLEKQIAKNGYEETVLAMRKLFKGFEHFYIIETGVYDTEEVKVYIEPLVKILQGTITFLPGQYKILHKIAMGSFDNDFIVLEPGQILSKDNFDKTIA